MEIFRMVDFSMLETGVPTSVFAKVTPLLVQAAASHLTEGLRTQPNNRLTN
jgi:hypothetical protein